MQRYFLDSDPNVERIELPKELAHHLVTVLRATVGTKLELVMGDHKVYLAELVTVEPIATVKLIKNLGQDSEMPVQVILACGVPKTKEKPELIVQKGTEMGASEIIFFEGERSVGHWNKQKQGKKIARLQKIADAAAEQSHRNVKPKVAYIPSLKELLNATASVDYRLVAWEESAKQGEKSALAATLEKVKAGDSLLGIFGPEGGLSENEVQSMVKLGVIPVGLGPRILRTETAPLYFLGAVSFATELLGKLK